MTLRLRRDGKGGCVLFVFYVCYISVCVCVCVCVCSLSSSRPSLSVVVFPLLHEDLPQVVREIPLTHLDQITLYKSRVAQQPPA